MSVRTGARVDTSGVAVSRRGGQNGTGCNLHLEAHCAQRSGETVATTVRACFNLTNKHRAHQHSCST